MKTIKLFSILFTGLFFATASLAQKETQETFPVSGNCGMCKTKIEKAAKQAGASYAAWDVENKEITVKYNSTASNTAKIKQAIAATGYDTPGFTATDEAYDNLHQCCKYERGTTKSESNDCCKGGVCSKEGHNGKDCCKKEMKSMKDCSKNEKCSKEGKEGKSCCKKDGDKKEGSKKESGKKDCCKGGSCDDHGK